MLKKLALTSVIIAVAAAGCAQRDSAQVKMGEKSGAEWRTLDGGPPLIIAHRGASGHRPEHTLEAYRLAIEMGADVIEPDLVFTKDGVLVARHDRYLSTTTNVADHSVFAGRKKPNADPAGNSGPGSEGDWWVEDFTLAEIKTLRARQPRDVRSKEFDDRFEIPTFEEVLAVVSAEATKAGRPVGVYPETKHPAYFASIGHDFEEPLLKALEDFVAGQVFIQSFEPGILRRLKGRTDAKLVQLVYEESPGAGPNIPLADIAEYADGVGPSKNMVLSFLIPHIAFENSIVANAHKLGLTVHAWTFRDDQANGSIAELGQSSSLAYIDRELGRLIYKNPSEPQAELEIFYELGVDGVFSDFPDTAFTTRSEVGNKPRFKFVRPAK